MRTKRTNETERGRVAIVQDCLEENVLPLLLRHMPTPRSNKQSESLRACVNYVAGIIHGNRKWLKEQKPSQTLRIRMTPFEQKVLLKILEAAYMDPLIPLASLKWSNRENTVKNRLYRRVRSIFNE